MRARWKVIWQPRPSRQEECAEAWRRWPREVGLPRAEQGGWTPPSRDEFVNCNLQATGGAGFDGWTAAEFRWAARNAEWLVGELRAVLVDATQEQRGEVVNRLATWRYVGIPKRTGGFRPIAVASVIHRVWQKLLSRALPPLSERQQCGRRGVSAVTAAASWMEHGGAGGVEYDLQKAFDPQHGGGGLAVARSARDCREAFPSCLACASALHSGRRARRPAVLL